MRGGASILAGLLLFPIVAAGSGWQEVEFPRGGFCEPTLLDVTFSSDQEGYVVGTCLTLLSTKDGGATWTRAGLGDFGMLTAVDFFTPELGVAVGVNAIFQPSFILTRNGGATWAGGSFYVQDPGGVQNEATLTDVTIRPTGLYATAAVWSGAGALVRSLDLGQTWTTLVWSDEALWALEADALGLRYVAVGSGGKVLTSPNGGLTWGTGEAPPEADMRDVALGPGTFEAWAVGMDGMALYSGDGGVGWDVVDTGFTMDLHDVGVTADDDVVAVGAGGAVIYKDDAASTWAQEVSPGPVDLYGLYLSPRDVDVAFTVGHDALYRWG